MSIVSMQRRMLGLVAGSALMTTAYAAEIPIAQDVKDSGQLAIASSLAYAPFEFVDEQGKPAGLDIELAKAVADRLGVKLKIVTIPFASQIPALASGRVKIAWATFSVTAERLAQVDFVSFLEAGTVVSTLPANKERFATQNGLCGASVAVQSGTAADFVADRIVADCEKAGLPAMRKAIYPEQKDVIQAVLSGRAEARLDDSTSAGYYEATSKGRMVVAGRSLYPAPLGAAVVKGDKATAEMLEAALSSLIADGTYATILDKYNLRASAVSKPALYSNPSQLPQ